MRLFREGDVRVPLIARWPEVAKAQPIADLPGLSLLPLLRGEKPHWRKYLYTEFHLHSAHNFYPQRTVRNEHYKLIRNLMPGEENPGYAFTLNRFFDDLPAAIQAAAPPVRDAYLRMKAPPGYELYDLRSDPYEFRNLTSDPEHAEALEELKRQLARWRRRTDDPLLEPRNLLRLKAEVEACLVDGTPDKSLLNLTYPEYFFAGQAGDELQAENP